MRCAPPHPKRGLRPTRISHLRSTSWVPSVAGPGATAFDVVLDHPLVSRLLGGSEWSDPTDGQNVTFIATAPPGAAVGGFRFGLHLDADDRIDRIEQDLLPPPPLEPEPVVLERHVRRPSCRCAHERHPDDRRLRRRNRRAPDLVPGHGAGTRRRSTRHVDPRSRGRPRALRSPPIRISRASTATEPTGVTLAVPRPRARRRQRSRPRRGLRRVSTPRTEHGLAQAGRRRGHGARQDRRS